jgi:hypothetical protein
MDVDEVSTGRSEYCHDIDHSKSQKKKRQGFHMAVTTENHMSHGPWLHTVWYSTLTLALSLLPSSTSNERRTGSPCSGYK